MGLYGDGQYPGNIYDGDCSDLDLAPTTPFSWFSSLAASDRRWKARAPFQEGRPGLLFPAARKRSNPSNATADKNGRLWMIRIAANKSISTSR
jgi:hypothetical protein